VVKKTTETLLTSTQSSSITEDETEDVYGEVPTEVSKFKSVSHSGEVRDLSYFAALRLLRPLLGREAGRIVDEELNPPYSQSLDRRIAEWKRHVGSTERAKRPQEEA
jgi:hypothetical protein